MGWRFTLSQIVNQMFWVPVCVCLKFLCVLSTKIFSFSPLSDHPPSGMLHTVPPVLWSSGLHLVEAGVTEEENHSFLPTPYWRCLLQR